MQAWQKLMIDFNIEQTRNITVVNLEELLNKFYTLIYNFEQREKSCLALAMLQENVVRVVAQFWNKLDEVMKEHDVMSDYLPPVLDIKHLVSNTLVCATAHSPPELCVQIVNTGMARHLAINLREYRELYREMLSKDEKVSLHYF